MNLWEQILEEVGYLTEVLQELNLWELILKKKKAWNLFYMFRNCKENIDQLGNYPIDIPQIVKYYPVNIEWIHIFSVCACP